LYHLIRRHFNRRAKSIGVPRTAVGHVLRRNPSNDRRYHADRTLASDERPQYGLKVPVSPISRMMFQRFATAAAPNLGAAVLQGCQQCTSAPFEETRRVRRFVLNSSTVTNDSRVLRIPRAAFGASSIYTTAEGSDVCNTAYAQASFCRRLMANLLTTTRCPPAVGAVGSATTWLLASGVWALGPGSLGFFIQYSGLPAVFWISRL